MVKEKDAKKTTQLENSPEEGIVIDFVILFVSEMIVELEKESEIVEVGSWLGLSRGYVIVLPKKTVFENRDPNYEIAIDFVLLETIPCQDHSCEFLKSKEKTEVYSFCKTKFMKKRSDCNPHF